MTSDLQVRIAAAGKIKDWDVKAKKDKIVFSGLELSPGQIEQLARLIQTKKAGEVRCTIEPTAKRLGLKPIISAVRIDGVDIRRKGILPAVSGFTVPADRSETMVRLVREETMLTVTFEVIQGELGFPDGTPAETGKPEGFAEDPVPQESGSEADDAGPALQEFEIKCSSMKGAKVEVVIERDSDGYLVDWWGKLGNYETHPDIGDVVRSRKAALEVLRFEVNQWLDTLEITGNADHQRSVRTRRDQMREQVNARLDEMIGRESSTPTADTSDTELDDDEGDEAET